MGCTVPDLSMAPTVTAYFDASIGILSTESSSSLKSTKTRVPSDEPHTSTALPLMPEAILTVLV